MHASIEKLIINGIKFFINLGGLLFIAIPIGMFGIVVRKPPCEGIMDDIARIIIALFALITGYLVLITGINFFIERKVEKQKESQSYLKLLLFHWIIAIVLTTFGALGHYWWACPP